MKAVLLFIFFVASPFLGANERPKAVVSLSLMADEILAFVAENDQIRAFSRLADDTTLSNVPAQALQNIKNRAAPNLEMILSFAPDLVLAADWNNPADLDFLRKRGIKVEVLKTPLSWNEILETTRRVGQLLKRGEAAEKWISQWEAKRRDLMSAWKKNSQTKKRVLEYNFWGTTGTKNTLWQTIVDLSQVENPAQNLNADQWGFSPLSKEMVLKINPDFLVLTESTYGNDGNKNMGEALISDALMKRLTAVKENRIIRIPEKFKSSSSPFLLEAVIYLFKNCYPNISLGK